MRRLQLYLVNIPHFYGSGSRSSTRLSISLTAMHRRGIIAALSDVADGEGFSVVPNFRLQVQRAEPSSSSGHSLLLAHPR